jgi:hypothetical protein
MISVINSDPNSPSRTFRTAVTSSGWLVADPQQLATPANVPITAIQSDLAAGDVSSGEDIPRKRGPGTTTADLLVVNKTDLAPYVGADLDTMASDAAQRRGDLPVVFTSLTSDDGVRPVADWVLQRLTAWRGGTARPEPAVAAH